MSEDEKAEAASQSLDPRTAEVLRFLDRAKGTIAKTEVPTNSPSAANLARELRALREGVSQTTPNIEATAQSLDSTARVLEPGGRRGRREASGLPTRAGSRRQRASRLSRPAHTSGGCPGRMARLVDEAGGYLGCGARAGPCRRDRARLASPRAGAEHPRHPAADPREPDQGTGRQGPEAPMSVHQPPRLGWGNLRECSVASRPPPYPDWLIWP